MILPAGSSESYYDLFEDWDLIVSSVLEQYGIRIYSAEFKGMKWLEFSALISGIGPDTALGRVVAIRAETDKEVIKHFSDDQRRIWREWRRGITAFRISLCIRRWISMRDHLSTA